MSKMSSAVITTACVGMAVGAAYMMSSDNKSMRSKTKKLRKNTGKALRQVGGFIENMSYMMK